MSGRREAERLRAALSRYREQTRAGKYPSALREQAEAYAQERVREGATPAEIAAELGVRKGTADRWASGGQGPAARPLPAARKTAESFPIVPVVLSPQRREEGPLRIKLEFPDGTRMQVSGIVGRDLAEAIEALRRTR